MTRLEIIVSTFVFVGGGGAVGLDFITLVRRRVGGSTPGIHYNRRYNSNSDSSSSSTTINGNFTEIFPDTNTKYPLAPNACVLLVALTLILSLASRFCMILRRFCNFPNSLCWIRFFCLGWGLLVWFCCLCMFCMCVSFGFLHP